MIAKEIKERIKTNTEKMATCSKGEKERLAKENVDLYLKAKERSGKDEQEKENTSTD